MAYLVTGGTGFIGSYVARDLLSEGKEVVCFQRSDVTAFSRAIVDENDLGKIKIVQGDLSNTMQLFRVIRDYDIDLVVHLGFLMVETSDLQPAYALRVNSLGMNSLLEAARLLGLKKVVWTSSNRAFGRLSEFYDKPIVDDDAIYMSDSMYGATKALNEFMAKLYFEKFGVDSLGLRLALTFGAIKRIGAPERFTQFLRSASLNLPTKIAAMDADRIQCFSYVENISDLIVKACGMPPTRTRIFNVPEYKCSIRQLVDIIYKVNPQARVTIEEKVETETTIWRGAPEVMVDTTRIQTELGWKPKYSLEGMIRKVFNNFRQQQGLSLL